MPNKRISQFLDNPAPSLADYFPIDHSGVTYKITLDAVGNVLGIANKLNTEIFSAFTATTLTIPIFSAYTANTLTILNNKVDLNVYSAYTGNTLTILNTKLSGITHDQSLTGDGSVINPLKVVGWNISDVVVTVRVATTANLAGAPVYNNGAAGSGATLTRGTNGVLPSLDGISLMVGDRILVKNQTTTLQNGIYEVTSTGSTITPWILTRTTDADTSTELDDMTVTPSEGSVNKGLLFAQQTSNPIVGTNPIVFTQISGIFVSQLSSGTQLAGQIPIYTATARQQTKGFSGFTYSATTGKTDLFTINSVPYFFPSGNTSGYLSNDGSGHLSWGTIPTPIDITVTGGTYSAGTAVFRNTTGGTFSVTGFTTGNTSFDVFVSGGTYSAGTATFNNTTGGTFSVTGFSTGGNSSIINTTYSDLKNLADSNSLVPSQWYAFEFESIYDQTISDVTKTGSTEVLIVLAISTNKIAGQVYSNEFPRDIIHYDLFSSNTFVNNVPTKGKIIYREDDKGNKTPFDFRNILMFNSFESTEALIFDLNNLVTETSINSNPAFLNIFSVEFPASTVTGDLYNNTNTLLVNALVEGNLNQTSSLFLFSSRFKSISQSANINIADSIFGGNIQQMINIDITECIISGSSDYCTTGTWSNTTFGEKVNKCIATNFSNSSIGNRIDRLISCAILNSTIGGRLYWCNQLALFNSDIVGGMQGLNDLTWTLTPANCNVENIKGLTYNSSKYGFSNCVISGTSSSDIFGNLEVLCLVENKTITQTDYPELFNPNYNKKIFKGSNGNIYYNYWNGLTEAYNQII